MGVFSEVDTSDKEGPKRQYRALSGKTVESPEVTGREAAGWAKDGHRVGKVQGDIRDVKFLTGTKQDTFFVW